MATLNSFSLLFSLAHKLLWDFNLLASFQFYSKSNTIMKTIVFLGKVSITTVYSTSVFTFTVCWVKSAEWCPPNVHSNVSKQWCYLMSPSKQKKLYRFKKLMRRSHPSCRHLHCEKGHNKQIKICQLNIQMKAGMLLEISSVR